MAVTIEIQCNMFSGLALSAELSPSRPCVTQICILILYSFTIALHLTISKTKEEFISVPD